MPKAENKIKIRSWSGKKLTSVVLEGSADRINGLFVNEHKSAEKIWKRDHDFKKLSEMTKKLLSDLLGNAEFKKVICRIFARKDNVSSSELLRPPVLRRAFSTLKDSAEQNNMELLVDNLVKLRAYP